MQRLTFFNADCANLALCDGEYRAALTSADLILPGGRCVPLAARMARDLFGAWTLNGSETRRYPGNLNLRQDGIDGARLLSYCRNVAFSLGSACASGSGRPSHVLRALGLTDAQARGSVRIGFGRYTTPDEVERAARALNEAAAAQAAP